MSLSRKRRKELGELRQSAQELWRDQQAILARAATLSRHARAQARYLTDEEVAPRVQAGYAEYVRPRLERGGSRLSSLSESLLARVAPAVGTAVGTAMSVGDIARSTRTRALERSAAKAAAKKKGGAGGTIALTIGLAIVAGIGYAAWQTFRADDELWVADEEPPAPVAD